MASALQRQSQSGAKSMTLRIDRAQERVLLSGDFRSEHVHQVKAELDRYRSPVASELEEVGLVDVEAIRFLNSCGAAGVSVLHGSVYIRTWMPQEHERPGGTAEREKRTVGKRFDWLRASIRINASLVVLLWMVYQPMLAQSQQPVTPSNGARGAELVRLPLTLREAVQLALKQNPREIIVRIEVEQRERLSDEALAKLLPQVAIDSTASVKRFNGQSITGGPVPAQYGPFQVLNFGGEFSQSLVDLPLIRRLQSSRQDIVTAKYERNSTREDIVSTVVTRYLFVQRAKATLGAAQAQRELAQRLFDQAAQLEKNGIGTGLDTLRANVELQNELQREIDASSSVQTASYALAYVLSLKPDQEVEAIDSMKYDQPPALDEKSLIQTAYQQRPELLAIASAQRSALIETKGVREQRLPSVTFEGSYFEQGRIFGDSIPAYTYTGTLHLPLWTSGRISAEFAGARLQEQRLAEQRRDTANSVLQQVRTAIEQLRASSGAVTVANDALDLARQEVARAERRFAAGVSTNIDVVTAQDQLARASNNQIEALYRYNQSRVDLARATGDVENIYAH
jgi:outer membrane protein